MRAGSDAGFRRLHRATMIPAAGPPGGAPDAASYPPPVVAWWAVFILLVFFTLSFLDRAILNLLVVPIQQSLHVSDVQMSLLQGPSFAIFYAVLGVPLGYLVDRRPRRIIVFVGVLVWSLATTASGLATRFLHLLLARVGVGGGEAALAPAAYSLISDLFPRHKMALPMSVMGIGGAVGTALAAIIAAAIFRTVDADGLAVPLLGRIAPWQLAFLVAGLPGLLLAPLIFTMREPARTGRLPTAGAAQPNPPAWRHLARHRWFYLPHFIGFGLISMCNYGTNAWLPTFLTRVRGLDIADAAWSVGTLSLVGVVPGGILMGAIVDRWYASGRTDAHTRFFSCSILVQAVAIGAALHVENLYLCYALIVCHHLFSSFTGVAATALQIVTPNQYRGQTSAIYLLIFNLIGLGLGPLAVALITERLFGDRTMVGDSITLVYACVAPVAGGLLYLAGRHVRSAAARAS